MSIIPWRLISEADDYSHLAYLVLKEPPLVRRIVQFRRETVEFEDMIELLRSSAVEGIRCFDAKWKFREIIEMECQETLAEVICDLEYRSLLEE